MSGSSHLNAKNVGHRECWSAPFLTRNNLRKDHPDTSDALQALGCTDSQQQGIGRPDRFNPAAGPRGRSLPAYNLPNKYAPPTLPKASWQSQPDRDSLII